mgnify:CR=1 FL=1
MPVKSYPDANPPDPADKVPDESVAAPFPEKLVARVEATRFDPDHPPPDEPWAFQLAGVEIAHSGNLITIAAGIKSGKSSVIAAMIASMMGGRIVIISASPAATPTARPSSTTTPSKVAATITI